MGDFVRVSVLVMVSESLVRVGRDVFVGLAEYERESTVMEAIGDIDFEAEGSWVRLRVTEGP